MRIRRGSAAPAKVEQQMVPMIDIVFQLLTFFIMSFKIVTEEGDFNIKMPTASRTEVNIQDAFLPPMRVVMTADAAGNLTGIQIAGESDFGTSFDALHQYIAQKVGAEGGIAREDAEVILDFDYNLKYENVVSAITAVSGSRQGDQVIKLVEKIQFAAPRKPGESPDESPTR
jgi:biopolymer transport protein ExbD